MYSFHFQYPDICLKLNIDCGAGDNDMATSACSGSIVTQNQIKPSVGISLKELGGQMSKCLKFCTVIEM